MSDEIREYWLSEEFQSKNEIAMEEISNYLVELGHRYEDEHDVRCIRFVEKRLKSVDAIVRYKKKKDTPKEIEKMIEEFTERLKKEDRIIQKIMETE